MSLSPFTFSSCVFTFYHLQLQFMQYSQCSNCSPKSFKANGINPILNCFECNTFSYTISTRYTRDTRRFKSFQKLYALFACNSWILRLCAAVVTRRGSNRDESRYFCSLLLLLLWFNGISNNMLASL